MIQTHNLSKIFQAADVETTALNRINLTIDQGEFIAIMGPSGCGKSTLLNILGLLDKPSSGQYLFDGEEMGQLKAKDWIKRRKGNIGFVFQNFNLIDSLSIYENVELPLAFMGVRPKVRKQRVSEILERLKIGHRRHHYPQQLSGGQQQRAAIARAVITKPKLILADEPTGNLDSKNGLEVIRLLTEFNQEGATIVMVTHSDHDAAFAHRIIQIFDGQLLTQKLTSSNFSTAQ